MKLDELTRAFKLRLGMIREEHLVLCWGKAGQSENHASVDTHCEVGEVEKEGHTLLFQLSKTFLAASDSFYFHTYLILEGL